MHSDMLVPFNTVFLGRQCFENMLVVQFQLGKSLANPLVSKNSSVLLGY